MILDHAIDAYFPILDKIDEFIDGLEDRVFTDFDESAIQDIFRVKRLVLSLRRYLAPQREVFNVLSNRPTPLLPPSVQLYFRDVYDHMLRINDSLDAHRELLSGTMDSLPLAGLQPARPCDQGAVCDRDAELAVRRH